MISYKLEHTFDIEPVRRSLDAHPEIWNTRTMRTEHPSSPHYGLDDIWARYAGPELENPAEQHSSIWYKDVCDVIPIESLADDVLRHYPGELGGVLLTRIKSGKLCRPHCDVGWHASYYNFKIMVSVAANHQQAFCNKEKFIRTMPGEAIFFNNSYEHWVPNVSDEDRISAIFCIRR